MEKYILAVGFLGIFFLALASLETLINFIIWLWQKRDK